MTTERQKYISGILRNIGFAMFAPAGSIAFQWLVLEKGSYFGRSIEAVIVFLLGWILIRLGYMVLGEKS